MLSGSPCQCLRGERRIARAAGAHHRGPENAEVRYFVRDPPPVDDVRLLVVTHTRTAIGMRRDTHRTDWPPLDCHRAGLHKPLRHLVLHEGTRLLLVVLEL